MVNYELLISITNWSITRFKFGVIQVRDFSCELKFHRLFKGEIWRIKLGRVYLNDNYVTNSKRKYGKDHFKAQPYFKIGFGSFGIVFGQKFVFIDKRLLF